MFDADVDREPTDIELLRDDLDDAKHLVDLLAQVRSQWNDVEAIAASRATRLRVEALVAALDLASKAANKLANHLHHELMRMSMQGASATQAKASATSAGVVKTPHPGRAGKDMR
jgi:hypothetical protein